MHENPFCHRLPHISRGHQRSSKFLFWLKYISDNHFMLNVTRGLPEFGGKGSAYLVKGCMSFSLPYDSLAPSKSKLPASYRIT